MIVNSIVVRHRAHYHKSTSSMSWAVAAAYCKCISLSVGDASHCFHIVGQYAVGDVSCASSGVSVWLGVCFLLLVGFQTMSSMSWMLC
jgi:hypothetical protein